MRVGELDHQAEKAAAASFQSGSKARSIARSVLCLISVHRYEIAWLRDRRNLGRASLMQPQSNCARIEAISDIIPLLLRELQPRNSKNPTPSIGTNWLSNFLPANETVRPRGNPSSKVQKEVLEKKKCSDVT